MGIPLLEGRFFNDHDRMGGELVIVVDDVLAKSAFARQELSEKAYGFLICRAGNRTPHLWTALYPTKL
jgi:hypothetical protein